MIKTYLADAAASVARDGVAPESGQDDPLREERHLQGTACVDNPDAFKC